MNAAKSTPTIRPLDTSYITEVFEYAGLDFIIEVDTERYQDGPRMGSLWVAKIYGPDGGLFREELSQTADGALRAARGMIARFVG